MASTRRAPGTPVGSPPPRRGARARGELRDEAGRALSARALPRRSARPPAPRAARSGAAPAAPRVVADALALDRDRGRRAPSIERRAAVVRRDAAARRAARSPRAARRARGRDRRGSTRAREAAACAATAATAATACAQAAVARGQARSAAPLSRACEDPGRGGRRRRCQPIRIPIAVTPAVARAAVRAALVHARLADPDAGVDALISRARASAALPELRLRASRTVDEGQALSPTEYDPNRTTATGGTSLWIEARATWSSTGWSSRTRRWRSSAHAAHRAAARARVVTQVLKLLFAWQRALALADNPAGSPEEHLAASLQGARERGGAGYRDGRVVHPLAREAARRAVNARGNRPRASRS